MIRRSEEERGIIEIYGQVLHSDHDWHDTDYLEGLILSKYDRETAIKVLRRMLGESCSRKKLESPGKLMEAYIQTAADRFIWCDEDVEILSKGVPYADGEMERRFEAECDDKF
ncbi:MAG: hypothetical protein JW738_05040 [Actinobacteria bacterium]|nr:hypothetical protein [Actinomycetota bacterium]